MTDPELVTAAQQGDQAAFGALVEKYQAMAYSLAFRMLGDSEDAADAVQDAFLNAWRALGSFQGQSAFSTWLYRLTSNACIDFLRRAKRRAAVSMTVTDEDEDAPHETEVPDERWSPERELERSEAHRAIHAGLAALSAEHREVLVLRELEGLSYQEIAQALGLEEGTVKSRIARARLALRDFLVKSGNFSFPPSSK